MELDGVQDRLKSFKASVLDEIALNASSNMTNDTEEFLEYVTDQLIEAEEIDEFNYVPFEGIGKQNRKLQVDGYAYNELDEHLDLFIALPLTYDDWTTLTNSDLERYVNRVIAFIESADYVKAHAEESSPGYGLACDILSIYKNVQKYRIYVLTDMIMSERLSSIVGLRANNKPVDCHVWDISRLFELAKSSNGREEVIIDLKSFGIPGIPCMPASATDDYTAYLCNMPGIVLANMYNKFGGRLLEGNVRSFLQVRGKVNKGIRATILNEPEMFFAYNNGIAATAYEIKTENLDGTLYITEISSLQIVNGGQTTASLATALIKDKKDNSEKCIEKIYVPMKLSIVTPEKSDALIANIAKYANSQNKVLDADFWSNHPFQIRMEELSRRILAPAVDGRQYGTYWYYERANGQYKQETYKSTPKEKEKFERHHPKNQMIDKTKLARYINISQMRPDVASLGGQKAFTTFSEWAAKEWGKNDTVFNEDFFRKVVSIAIIYSETDRIVKRQKHSYKANIISYALAKIFYTIKVKHPDKAVAYKTIWQKQKLTPAWLNQVERATELAYIHLTDPNRDIENVTEWAKRERCWEQAKLIPFELNKDFVEELQNSYEQEYEINKAKADQKLANQLSALVTVVNYGSEGWHSLLEWNASHRVLSPSEIHWIELAERMDGGLITSERNCSRVLKILEKCRIEGFPG